MFRRRTVRWTCPLSSDSQIFRAYACGSTRPIVLQTRPSSYPCMEIHHPFELGPWILATLAFLKKGSCEVLPHRSNLWLVSKSYVIQARKRLACGVPSDFVSIVIRYLRKVVVLFLACWNSWPSLYIVKQEDESYSFEMSEFYTSPERSVQARSSSQEDRHTFHINPNIRPEFS